MKTLLISFQLVAAAASIPGQIDSVCRTYCQALAVQSGIVRSVDLVPPTRTLAIGRYAQAARRLVPPIEAPIRDMTSAHGWRIIVSAFLDHDEGEAKLRLRFFDPSGSLRITQDLLSALEHIEIGRRFGGTDEIFAITSDEEHAYNVQTEIWFLPQRENPKRLLRIRGFLEGFSSGDAGKSPGVTIARETYDGVHAETKGTVQEFYAWDRQTKSLIHRLK
jgi:hypothetical protein